MFDFAIIDDGELKFDIQNKDISKSQYDATYRQIALCRIKSIVGDWYNTTIGANLEQYLGEECNIVTANNMIDSIKQALSYDNFIDKKDIYCIPKVEERDISILVFINSMFDGQPSLINVRIDIAGGVKVNYGTLK